MIVWEMKAVALLYSQMKIHFRVIIPAAVITVVLVTSHHFVNHRPIAIKENKHPKSPISNVYTYLVFIKRCQMCQIHNQLGWFTIRYLFTCVLNYEYSDIYIKDLQIPQRHQSLGKVFIFYQSCCRLLLYLVSVSPNPQLFEYQTKY